jgi:hypothetical protein
MEKLHYRSDGAAETSSGLFAVLPVVRSGTFDGKAYFEYKATPIADITRIEWPATTDVVLIAPDIARELVRSGYATGLTSSQVERYNSAVDEWLATNPDDAKKIAEAEVKKVEPTTSDVLSEITPANVPVNNGAGEGAGDVSGADEGSGAPSTENAHTTATGTAETPLDASPATPDNGQASVAPVAPVIPVKPNKKA